MATEFYRVCLPDDFTSDDLRNAFAVLNQQFEEVSLELARVKGAEGNIAALSSDLNLNAHRIISTSTSRQLTDAVSRRELRDRTVYIPKGSNRTAKTARTRRLVITDSAETDQDALTKDKADGLYAPEDKGVTNGDSHDHIGGDGAAIAEGALSLSNVTTADVTTTAHGFAPKSTNNARHFLNAGNPPAYVWPPYALQIMAAALATPVDGATYYCGGLAGRAPSTSANIQRIRIPRSGTITRAYIYTYAETAGTNEDISVYIRLNNTTDTLIQTVGAAANIRNFTNTSLAIAVAAADYIELKIVCPTWATDPANWFFGGSILVEN